MIHSESKYRMTRKAHTCSECKRQIPPKTKCYWFKAVTFRESEVGRNEWYENYVCPECDEKLSNAKEYEV